MSGTFLGMPSALPHATDRGTLTGRPFPEAARDALANTQLRHNLGHATSTIRRKRAGVVAEVPDWEELRDAGAAIKDDVLARLPELLEQFEVAVTARGGQVHWARDADDANRIVADLVRATGADQVVKVKSMATQEIGLNEALADAGIAAIETDLAELIVQLADDTPSHILVPAIHRNRAEIRQIFLDAMPGVDPALTDDPRVLAMAARAYLRTTFLAARVAISGANFGVAETGTLAVVESEGNGRMCLTLPQTLITVMGIEKLVPTWRDLEVFLQLLPRSSTGERMNPYTSLWTGVTPGDGPQDVHVVLLDNGRTAVLADRVGRAALRCIRCSACLNVCPVYERTGGHAYGSVYPGPIGAVLTPQLTGMDGGAVDTLVYASSLCGACYEVCPSRSTSRSCWSTCADDTWTTSADAACRPPSGLRWPRCRGGCVAPAGSPRARPRCGPGGSSRGAVGSARSRRRCPPGPRRATCRHRRRRRSGSGGPGGPASTPLRPTVRR